MFKKQGKLYIGIIVLTFIYVSFFTNLVFAEDTPLLIEKDIILKNGCEVKDTSGETSIFPKTDSPSVFLGICVLAKALEQGFISDLKLKNDPNLGLYVQGISDIEPGSTEFWGLWQNEEFASCGIGCLSISEGDTLSLVLTDWMAETESTKIIFHITELVSSRDITPPLIDEDGSSGGGSIVPPSTFNVQNALAYLESVQSADGSFGGSDLYTDWAGIAFGAMNANNNYSDSSKDKFLAYLNSHNTINSLVTDNERRAMAILSFDKNPYSFGDDEINYIEAITDSFDGAQLGDDNLDNDDIFGLIVLPKVGYTKNDEIVSKTISFILSAQVSNGSWDNSPDMTAAAIQALEPFDSVDGVSEALSKASDYMEDEQNSDGGWGNVFSTSWAMQAMNATGASWSKNGKTGIDYLTTQQMSDGAVSPLSETLQNRIWATSYAIPASLGKPWSEIMRSVPKPANQSGSNNSVTDLPENPNPQTLTDPVICPSGDLFSVTTGQACTKTTPIPDTVTPNSNIAISTPVINIKPSIKKTTITPKIIPDTLTASVTNALLPADADPPTERTSHAASIILGALSGIVLLYLAFKFFII